MEAIQREDLTPALAAHSGNRTFAERLLRIERGEELLRVLGCYVHFNSVFGSGAANLAGEIGARQDLFRDSDETVETLADRSVEVAADIFFAAIDEFGGTRTVHRSTHRMMAQATVKATAAFLGYGASQLNEIARPNDETLVTMRKVREGYGLNRPLDDETIFRAIGFHMGSEILADEEFNILDGYLREHQPDLSAYLKATRVTNDGTEHAAYQWIRVHTSVETDHFDAALISAQRALQYYTGAESPGRVKSFILDGFGEFAALQTEFIEGLR